MRRFLSVSTILREKTVVYFLSSVFPYEFTLATCISVARNSLELSRPRSPLQGHRRTSVSRPIHKSGRDSALFSRSNGHASRQNKSRWTVAQQQVRSFLERSLAARRVERPSIARTSSSFPLHIPRFDSVSCTGRTRKMPRLSCVWRIVRCPTKNRDTNCIASCKSKRERRIPPKWDQETASQLVFRQSSERNPRPRRSFVASFRELWRSQTPFLPPRGKQET